ncbi:rhodanese-like domain-containing protein [Methylocapsa acidiphila]|uniref:rhodanese-like domain-containing protein n=1 Tax=Methylocapsa acidiphila TaxID=133552 RepID=UPI0003F71294|nr:rhodanese-like domain-containing protein [Methylocapsa acidiphila]
MNLSGRSALGGLLLLALASGAVGQTPEPQGYWTGHMHGEVPATLAGAKVIHVDALAELLRGRGIVLIDAAEPPHRPDGLAPGSIWKPAPHQNLPGSLWMPGVGAGQLDEAASDMFRARLQSLADGDFQHPLVFYCHQNCWASWNAAKRALSFGYHNVYWYPDGPEAWRDSGRDLVESPPAEILPQPTAR